MILMCHYYSLVMDWILSPSPNSYVEILTFYVTVVGDKAVKEVIEVK